MSHAATTRAIGRGQQSLQVGVGARHAPHADVAARLQARGRAVIAEQPRAHPGAAAIEARGGGVEARDERGDGGGTGGAHDGRVRELSLACQAHDRGNRPAFQDAAPGATVRGMSLAELVKALCTERGLSYRAASLKAGEGPDFVRDIVRGKAKSPGSAALGRLAAVLGVDSDTLIAAADAKAGDAGGAARPGGLAERPRSAFDGVIPSAPPRPLPLLGYVRGGAWQERDAAAQAPLGRSHLLPHPRYAHVRQWAELLQGDSVNLVWPSGTEIRVADAVALGYRPRPADFVLVERERDGAVERTVKQVRFGPDGVQLVGHSRDPHWNQPLALDDAGEDATVRIVGLVTGGYVPAPEG